MMASTQVQRVRRHIGWPIAHEHGGYVQRHAQCRHNRSRDLLLDCEHIVHGAIERFSPELMASVGIDQPRGDTQPLASPSYAALEHVLDIELLGNGRRVSRRTLELERRGSRRDSEPRYLRQRVKNFLTHAVAKVVVVFSRTDVGKRQDGNRRQKRRAGRGGWPIGDAEQDGHFGHPLNARLWQLRETPLQHRRKTGRDRGFECGQVTRIAGDRGFHPCE
jgi:hypothetical protein